MELKETVCTLIWVSQRSDIKEFGLMRTQFALRFGPNVDHEALCNIDRCVSTLVEQLLSVNSPPEEIVFDYLCSVAKEFNLPWHDLHKPAESQPEAPVDEEESAIYRNMFGSLGSSASQNLTDTQSLNNPGGVFVDLDQFESMFTSVPSVGSVTTATVRSVPQEPQVQQVQSLSGPSIQRVVRVAPSSVLSEPKITPISGIQLKKEENPSPSRTEKPQMSKELAEMSTKDLESEFQQLFTSLTDPVPLLPSSSSINLSKGPPLVEPLADANLYSQEHVSTGQSSEYDDLFFGSELASGKEEDATDEYDVMFNRLSSATANPSIVHNQEVPDAESLEEWEARFVGGTSSPFVAGSSYPASGDNDDEELMQRFQAL